MRKTILIIFLLVLLYIPVVDGEGYISEPSNIPFFEGFDTSSTISESSGNYLNFTILNRYDKDMSNITLSVAFYKYATKDTVKSIDEISSSPLFENNERYLFIEIESLSNDTQVAIQIPLGFSFDPPEGVYFVRLEISFDYENTTYIMKSKGHFTEEEWRRATRLPIDDNESDQYYLGNVNLTYLEVDGIIPETSFYYRNGKGIGINQIFLIIVATVATLIISFIITLVFIQAKKQQIIQNRKNYRKAVMEVFIICLLFSIIFSGVLWGLQNQKESDSGYNRYYETAVYSRYDTTGSILVNNIDIAENISRISGKTGFTDYEDEIEWATFMSDHCDNLHEGRYQNNGVFYAIEIKMHSGGYFAYGRMYYSPFYKSLPNARYKIYENDFANIWLVYYTGIG